MFPKGCETRFEIPEERYLTDKDYSRFWEVQFAVLQYTPVVRHRDLG